MSPDPAFPATRDDQSATESAEVSPPDTTPVQPAVTLLRTAAAHRPVAEVALLVGLLKQTGDVPNPGDVALRAAALTRPVDEVTQLVALLNEPPHGPDTAEEAVRVAAVARP